MLFLISDTHFYHKKIIEYCGRPENFNELIIDGWNKTVDPSDTTIHLGDFAIGRDYSFDTKRESYKTLMNSLNGEKILIRGNHDRETNSFYKDIGFNDVFNYFTMEIEDITFLFLHYPIEINEEYMKDSLKEFIKSIKSDISFDAVIHGHTHNRIVGEVLEGNVSKLDDIIHINCSVENTDYKPVSMEEILEVVKKYI